MSEEILLGIVDDETLIVTLLAAFFNSNDGTRVVYQADSSEALIEYLKTDHKELPQIILLDINMKGMSGIDALPIIKELRPEIHVVVISSHYKKNFMGFMLKTGVAAFLPKGISPLTLKDVVIEIARNGFYFLPEQLAMVRDQISSRAPQIVLEKQEQISEREHEVLQLICKQHTAKEIAEKLFIAQSTVESHKKRLLEKTNTKNTVGLVLYAVQHGIIDLDSIHTD